MQPTVAANAAKSGLCVILLSWPLFGQEFSRPNSQNKPMPEAAVYRIFMTHVATFEQAAHAAEQQGHSGSPWRNHLQRKYGITAKEQEQPAQTILDYHSHMNDIRTRLRAESAMFGNTYFPQKRSVSVSQAPIHLATIHALKQEEDNLTLSTKALVHAQLGDARFGAIDRNVHEQITRMAVKQ